MFGYEDPAKELEVNEDVAQQRMPAARCRECGALTHTCCLAPQGAYARTYLDGVRRLPKPKHAKGCSMPPGRLHLRELAYQMPSGRKDAWLDRIRRCMDDYEVRQMLEQMLLEIETSND